MAGVPDEDEEEEDDEKRSQRLGMVRSDARTDGCGALGKGAQKTLKDKRDKDLASVSALHRIEGAGAPTAEVAPRRDVHTREGHSPASAVSEDCGQASPVSRRVSELMPTPDHCPGLSLRNLPHLPLPAAIPSTSEQQPIRPLAERPRLLQVAAQWGSGSVAHLSQWAPGARSQRSLLPGDSGLAPPPRSPRTLLAEPLRPPP